MAIRSAGTQKTARKPMIRIRRIAAGAERLRVSM
jgi:hypothetical protein